MGGGEGRRGQGRQARVFTGSLAEYQPCDLPEEEEKVKEVRFRYRKEFRGNLKSFAEAEYCVEAVM